jgi:energy-coupling factor transport system substrate-specific component
MQEILSPLKSKQTLLQILVCALAFIGMAIPFKVMVLVEGFTEVRPVNAVPVVAGLIFGPAGAWGCAFGNIISDLFGTFSYGSIFGFFGNFIAAYLPYKLWHLWSKGERPNVKTYKNIFRYVILSAISSLAVAILIACSLDIFLNFWSRQILYIILFNNLGFPIFLGLPVFIVLTCDDIHIDMTMPAVPSRHRQIKWAALSMLICSSLLISIMITLGFVMSASLLMIIAGIIFAVSLIAIIIG